MGRTNEISFGSNLKTYTSSPPQQTGQGHQADLVRPPPAGGQTALPRREQFPPKKVYKPKIREEEVQEMDIDSKRTTSLDIIQIGTMNVPIEGSGKRPLCQIIWL
jgi:hypothetical protein